MRYKFTGIFTLFAVALSLFHYFGFDPNNIIYYSLSIPAWFIPVATNISNVHVFYLYALTVLSWTIMGYIADRLIIRGNVRNRGTGTKE